MIYNITINSNPGESMTGVFGIIHEFVKTMENNGLEVVEKIKRNHETFDEFENIVCEEVSKLQNKKVKVNDLIKNDRHREIVYARQIITTKMIKSCTLQTASNRFDQNHATVLHSHKKVKLMFETDSRYRAMIQLIEERTKCKIY